MLISSMARSLTLAPRREATPYSVTTKSTSARIRLIAIPAGWVGTMVETLSRSPSAFLTFAVECRAIMDLPPSDCLAPEAVSV